MHCGRLQVSERCVYKPYGISIMQDAAQMIIDDELKAHDSWLPMTQLLPTPLPWLLG